MKIMPTVAFVVLLLPGCSKPEAGDVLRVLEAQKRAWNAGSVDGYMEGYFNSDELTFVSGGTVTKGYNFVRDRYHRAYSSPEQMGVLSFSDLKVIFLSNASAVVTGEWRLKRQTDEPWGRFTLLVEKKPEGWKIVYDHTSKAAP
jgi:ketosteroid isomerase-like protein